MISKWYIYISGDPIEVDAELLGALMESINEDTKSGT